MINDLLFYIHYALVLLFGVVLSMSFCGIRAETKRNVGFIGLLFVICGSLQLGGLMLLGEEMVWKLYPVIVHLPLVIAIAIGYRKKLITILTAVSAAYLCCQPAKWCGILIMALTQSVAAEYLVRIAVLIAMLFAIPRWISESLALIYRKDSRSVWIFGMIPLVYYLFDYSMGIYTNFWSAHNLIALEFLPFFLCFVYLLFCFVYYKQYEQKADAQRREQIVRIAIEQQTKELETVKRSNAEVRMLRHDMRLLMSSLGLCIEKGDLTQAKQIIDGYISRIDGTAYRRFCGNDMVNYVLSDYAARCKASDVAFLHTVEVDSLKVDEIQFCSILSNALDNALNAQQTIDPEQRQIRLLLKSADGKLLLSVVNPVSQSPVIVDGLPVTDRKGHGYGAQSIRYLSQRMGGNCQFTMEDDLFVVRVIL